MRIRTNATRRGERNRYEQGNEDNHDRISIERIHERKPPEEMDDSVFEGTTKS
jgi:hypothetical protein